MESSGERPGTQIDLGLALLEVAAKRGRRFTRTDIAAWADCSPEAIAMIEQKARRKLLRRLADVEIREVGDLPPLTGGGSFGDV